MGYFLLFSTAALHSRVRVGMRNGQEVALMSAARFVLMRYSWERALRGEGFF